MTKVTIIDLPFPPSANRIWRVRPNRRVSMSTNYRDWIDQADKHAMQARQLELGPTITGAFECDIYLDRAAGTGDIDNRAKAILDWCQTRGVISNDKHCQRLTIAWSDAANAPSGCRAILREL